MTHYKTHISYFAMLDMAESWEFTGGIKYEKYSKSTRIEFEIKYIIMVPRTFPLDLFMADYPVEQTAWITERHFYFVEQPEITITDCN